MSPSESMAFPESLMEQQVCAILLMGSTIPASWTVFIPTCWSPVRKVVGNSECEHGVHWVSVCCVSSCITFPCRTPDIHRAQHAERSTHSPWGLSREVQVGAFSTGTCSTGSMCSFPCRNLCHRTARS